MPTVFNLTGHGFLVAKLPRESEQFQQAARDPPKTSFFLLSNLQIVATEELTL